MVQQQIVEKVEQLSKSVVKKEKQEISQEIIQVLEQEQSDENLYTLVNMIQDSNNTSQIRSIALKQLNFYFSKLFKQLQKQEDQNDEQKKDTDDNTPQLIKQEIKQKINDVINQFLQTVFLETDRHIRKLLCMFIPKQEINYQLSEDKEYKDNIKQIILQNLQSDDKINVDAALNLIDNYLIEDIEFIEDENNNDILKIIELNVAPEKDIMVRVSSLNAYFSLISVNQEGEHLTAITTQICNLLKEIITSEEYSKAYSKELLDNLQDGIQTNPEFLDKNFTAFFQCVMEIISDQEKIHTSIRYKLLDIIVIYLSDKQKFPITRPQKFVNDLISGLMAVLTPSYEEIPEELANYDYKFKIEKFLKPFYDAMQSIDELFSIKKIQQFTVPYFEIIFTQFLSSNKWQQQFAAIMACSQIVEHLNKAGSEEEEIPEIISKNIQKIFEISSSNNLLIKLAVAHWIGQSATDLQLQFQEKYGKKVLKLLRQYVDNDNEIIKAHSLAAVTNLAEESKDIEEITEEKEILLEMVEMSLGYLEKSALIMLKENSLALVGSVAECLTKQFVPMLEKSVIVIQDVLHNADGDDYQQMKGQCYETLSIISAHLQEDFKPYIHKLVNILLNEPQENITNIHSNFRCYWIDGIRRLINIKNKEVLEEDQEKFSKLVSKTYDFYQKLVDQLEYVENEYENEIKLLGKAEKDNGESEEEGEEEYEEDDEIAAAAGGNTKKNQLEEDENEGEEEDESRIDFKTYAENIVAVLKVTTVGLEDFPELFKEQAQSFILTKIFDLLQKSTFMQDQSEAILETLGFLLEIYKEKYSDLFTESTIDKYIEQLNELFYDDARQNILDLDSGKGGEVLQNYLVVFEELIYNCRFPIKKETAQTIIEKIIDLPLNQIQIKMINEFKIAKDQEEKNYFQSILEEVDVCQMQVIENLGAFLKNAQSYESQSLYDYLFNQPYKSKVSNCISLYEQTKYSPFARFAACYCCDLIDYYPQCTEINLVLTILINLQVVDELKTMQATAYGYGIAFKNLDISQEDQEKLLEILFKMHKNAKPTKSKKQVQLMYTKDNILSALYKSILDNKCFSKLQNPQEKFEQILALGQFVKDKDEILNILKSFIKQVENPEMVKLINGENNKNTETFLTNISQSLQVITEKENDVLKKNQDIGNQVFEACKKLIKDIEKDQQQKLYEKLLH